MIEFREIDRHNFLDVIDLRVAEEQKSFVAPNVFSLAQAKAFPECICLAIYYFDVLVGLRCTAWITMIRNIGFTA